MTRKSSSDVTSGKGGLTQLVREEAKLNWEEELFGSELKETAHVDISSWKIWF